MEIFGDIEIKEEDEILFSKMTNSTCSVGSKVSNISMHERDFIDFLFTSDNIKAIDCNFGHLRLEGYEYPGKKANPSGRGRKANKKKKSTRKLTGDGTCFNSQITFELVGSCVRQISDVDEDNKLKPGYISIEDLGDGTEKITKIYKIKLFRDGVISIPGSLKEDLSDCVEPLNKLCEHLSFVTNLDVQMSSPLKIDMLNYKFRLRDKHIDLRALQDHFAEKHKSFTLVRFEDILDFMIKPIFDGYSESPNGIEWTKFLTDFCIDTTNPSDFNYDALRDILVKSDRKGEVVFVIYEELQREIQKLQLHKVYAKLQFTADAIKNNFGYSLGDRIICRLLYISVIKKYNKLKEVFTSSKNNDVSSIRYYSERFQGFIIRKKAREAGTKPTTIKLFTKGKVNIDHAKSPEEARLIYRWLNRLLLENKELTFNPEISPDDLDPDDEWSYTSSEEETTP
jgi:hypothetical protein